MRLEPTGRNPRHYTVSFDDLEDGVQRLVSCPHQVMLVAGNRQAQAVVRVVAVDDDGQVHFTVLPGSVDKNRHLIGRALA